MIESYLQRAELLADLGQYQEAAQELVEAPPTDVAAATLLARVRLASGAPREALAATDTASEAGTEDRGLLVARGMALAELGRVDEAAAHAERVLRLAAGDAYALTSAAVILAMVRNGQVALDAAWEGVRLAPEQPRAHLVLGLVAGGLGLGEITQRAYREALALDPQLLEAEAAVGVVRRELYRYATVLGRITGAGGTAPAGGHRPGEGLRRTFQAITERFRSGNGPERSA